MNPGNWRRLVDLIHAERNNASTIEIGHLLNLNMPNQEVEAIAARSNMTTIVGLLHDPSSQMLSRLLEALSAGKLCVVDISQMRGQQGFVLAGIVLRQIFSRNQDEFTKQEPKTIPTIAVIEEAQSVLQERAASAEPFISWVKEGRKYDLGAVLITQQPGSIPNEILSQGDNWFIFHLLSAADLQTLRSANSHFSSDLLSSLLNEPIRGQGIFWSSAAGREYPMPVRVRSFENDFKMLDPDGSKPAAKTFAKVLNSRSATLTKVAESMGAVAGAPRAEGEPESAEEKTVPDVLVAVEQRAIAFLRDNIELQNEIRQNGVKWGTIQSKMAKAFADIYDDAFNKIYELNLVRTALDGVFGSGGWITSKDGNKAVVKAPRSECRSCGRRRCGQRAKCHLPLLHNVPIEFSAGGSSTADEGRCC